MRKFFVLLLFVTLSLILSISAFASDGASLWYDLTTCTDWTSYVDNVPQDSTSPIRSGTGSVFRFEIPYQAVGSAYRLGVRCSTKPVSVSVNDFDLTYNGSSDGVYFYSGTRSSSWSYNTVIVTVTFSSSAYRSVSLTRCSVLSGKFSPTSAGSVFVDGSKVGGLGNFTIPAKTSSNPMYASVEIRATAQSDGYDFVTFYGWSVNPSDNPPTFYASSGDSVLPVDYTVGLSGIEFTTSDGNQYPGGFYWTATVDCTFLKRADAAISLRYGSCTYGGSSSSGQVFAFCWNSSPVISDARSIINWMNKGFQSVIDRLDAFFGSDDVDTSSSDNLDNQSTQLSNSVSQLDNLNKPSADDVDLNIDIDSDSMGSYMMVINPLFSSAALLKVFILGFTLLLVSYVFFGKKGS